MSASPGRWLPRLAALAMAVGLARGAGLPSPAAASGASAAPVAGAAAPASQVVYVVPVEGAIEPGLSSYMRRGFAEARRAAAAAVLIEVDTLGGRVDAALQIRDLILHAELPVYAYVKGRAWSAGALITLAAERIAMAPESSIGAAEPRPADEKTVSALRGEFAATAQARKRDPNLAAAMVDKEIEISGVVRKGEILTLTAQRAFELKLIDAVTAGRAAALEAFGLPGARTVVVEERWADRLTRFVTGPVVAPILLSLATAAVVAEFYTPGFGLAGAAGAALFALFFWGHLLSGLAGWETVGLFALGLALLAVEAFLPGFGVFGVAGGIALLLSLFLAIGDVTRAAWAVALAVGLSAATLAVLSRYATRRSFLDRLFLRARLDVSVQSNPPPAPDARQLVGRSGVALTPLRPAGAARIDDRRLDVVTEGEFVGAGEAVTVIKVEGGRVVVRRSGT